MTIRFSDVDFPLNAVVTMPSRSLDTTFTPNTSRPTLCIYTVEIGGTTTLLSGDDGTIELRSDTSSPPTTVRCSHRNRIFQGLGVTVGTNVITQGVLTYWVPPNHNVRLVTVTTVAAPTFALIKSCEITF